MKSASQIPATPDGPLTRGILRGPNITRLLVICNVDIMAWLLLKGCLISLKDAGYEIHIACTPGEYFPLLAEQGFQMHAISFRRTFWPWAHVLPVFQLWSLMRKIDFAGVSTHSAVGSAIGRLAAWLAGCRPVVYTVHGFLFHENMPAAPRSLLMAVEWLLGRITTGFMFVSAEDNHTATQTGIVPAGVPTVTIFNGIDLAVFSPREANFENTGSFKRKLGIDDITPVVGIVGRIVREKGYREFLEMACLLNKTRKVVFLVVGDTLPSDRDQFGKGFRSEVAKAGMTSHFLFAGQTNLVADHLRTMDIFVLPSYREGFPRSVVEAMGVGLPVVATNVRGCREAVVQGVTGLIVPPKKVEALAEAVEHLLANPEKAAAMGRAGRERAVELFDCREVQHHFVDFVEKMLHDREPNLSSRLPERQRPT